MRGMAVHALTSMARPLPRGNGTPSPAPSIATARCGCWLPSGSATASEATVGASQWPSAALEAGYRGCRCWSESENRMASLRSPSGSHLACAIVHCFRLWRNAIGDLGVRALTQALESGALPKLESCDMNYNRCARLCVVWVLIWLSVLCCVGMVFAGFQRRLARSWTRWRAGERLGCRSRCNDARQWLLTLSCG